MKNYILPLIISFFLILPVASQAQLLKVKQTVFGMDCAPCAYGLEQSIQKLDGVESASVSLNNGLLTVNLKKNNQLTLQRIRKAVENSGFKAMEANITIAGTVAKNEPGNYVLKTGTGERFLLKAEDKRTLNTVADAKGNIIVSGKVEGNEKSGTVLWIESVDTSKG